MSQSSFKDIHVLGFHDQLRMSLNPSTDGSNGLLRAPPFLNHLQISDDAEAIAKFLALHTNNQTTFRIYQKEFTRLQMWAVLKLGIPLSSLNIDHYRQYIKFMMEPDVSWVGPRARIESINWRPFTDKRIYSDQTTVKKAFAGTLTSISCINSFLSWLNKIGYLMSNPMYLLRLEFMEKPPSSVRDGDKTKFYFDEDSLLDLQSTLKEMSRDNQPQLHKYQLSKILVAMTYHLNASLYEISKASMSNFVLRDANWYWIICDSKGAEKKTLLNEEMLEALLEWQTHLGYSKLQIDHENIPLIPPISVAGRPLYYRGGLGARRLAMVMQELINETTKKIELSNPSKAKRFAHATSRWLRYTNLRKQNALIRY